MPVPVSLDRFLGMIERGDPGECWEWPHARTPDGYGVLGAEGRRATVYAHRASAQLLGGQDVDGKIVRHRCNNPPCFNPRHLVAGTHLENVADMIEAQSHPYIGTPECLHGHPRTPENTYTRPNGQRECRPCAVAREKSRVRDRRKSVNKQKKTVEEAADA